MAGEEEQHLVAALDLGLEGSQRDLHLFLVQIELERDLVADLAQAVSHRIGVLASVDQLGHLFVSIVADDQRPPVGVDGLLLLHRLRVFELGDLLAQLDQFFIARSGIQRHPGLLLGNRLLRQALLLLDARLLRDPLKFLRTRGFSQTLLGHGLLRDALHLLGFLGQPRFGLGSARQLLPGCALLGKTLQLLGSGGLRQTLTRLGSAGQLLLGRRFLRNALLLLGFGGLGQTLALLGGASKLLLGRSFLRKALLLLGFGGLGQTFAFPGRTSKLLFRLSFPGQRLLNLSRGLQRIQRSAVG